MKAPDREQEITIKATKEQIPVISAFIEEVMASAGFDLKKIMEVQLAAEEVCTNIALYAYSRGDGLIRLAARVAGGRLDLVIEDEGTPFDPTAVVATIPDAKVEDRQIGGLGIPLIKSYVDGIAYEFKDGKNALKLVKKRA